MKRTPPKSTPDSPGKPARGTSDMLCKRLAEQYPEQFARWLFGVRGKVRVEKTELDREPIRADSIVFAHEDAETLHTEFQTTLKSYLPPPLRMLDYYVGLKRQAPQRRVRQVLVVLCPTDEPVPDRYVDERTTHIYDVVLLPELDPAELLEHPGLLPLATLCRAASGEQLLTEVATRIRRIKARQQRRDTLNWSRVLAGLRYDAGLIYSILKESDMLEESVVYQDIFQKGAQHGKVEGVEQGARQEARKLAEIMLEWRFGKPSRALRRQLEQLVVEQLEALCRAVVEFKSKDDLNRWLKQHAPAR